MIKKVEMIDWGDTEKLMVYAPTDTECMCEQRDRDIMKSVTCGGEFHKFTAKQVKGAEQIKNDEHLWYDTNHNIYQVCSGCATDMNGNIIPNAFFVRLVGIWFDCEKVKRCEEMQEQQIYYLTEGRNITYYLVSHQEKKYCIIPKKYYKLAQYLYGVCLNAVENSIEDKTVGYELRTFGEYSHHLR
ncbi:MAG: hypothetical protein K0R54_1867 [Clostridiaceae bacterium]|jgi:hypothetical protein|nr:hypothetical protein [Clostridiaceae bacterium]